MEFRFLPILAIAITLAFAVSHAALPAETYWRSVFPNTPMPKALRNLPLPAAGNKKPALADLVKGKKYEDGVVPGGIHYARASKDIKGSDMIKYRDAFFLDSELRPGRKMNIKEVTEKPSKAALLPRSVAESIPFSTQKFPEILKYFSLEAKSEEANLLKQTIESCEVPATEGEERYCTTSLESFVESGVSTLGKNIQILSTELEEETQNQEFTIGQGVKMMGESEVVFHKMDYAYAVFLCHSIDKTAVYTVPLVGADGTKARALAVCHKDTSAWNPKHLSFQILKVKTGTVPICHFLERETLIWVPD